MLEPDVHRYSRLLLSRLRHTLSGKHMSPPRGLLLNFIFSHVLSPRSHLISYIIIRLPEHSHHSLPPAQETLITPEIPPFAKPPTRRDAPSLHRATHDVALALHAEIINNICPELFNEAYPRMNLPLSASRLHKCHFLNGVSHICVKKWADGLRR